MQKNLYNQYLLLMLPALFTYILFVPAFSFDFLNFDDNKLIYENRIVTNGEQTSLKDILEFQRFRVHYKPVTVFTWNWEYIQWGDDPEPYHKHNVYLHVASTLLLALFLFFLIRKITASEKKAVFIAVFGALIFGIHPMHVESVAWVTERKDVLYGLFFIAGMLTYLLYKIKGNFGWLFLSIALYFLSSFSKSPGVALIGIIVLLGLILEKRINLKLFLEKIPFILVLFFAFYNFGLLTDFHHQTEGLTAGIANQGISENTETLKSFSPLIKRLLLINFKFWFWVGHVIIPVNLSLDYPRDLLLEATGKWIYILPLLSIGLAVLLYKIRKNKIAFFAISFFIITIIPSLAVADKGVGIFVSDRYTYIASIGLFLAILYGLSLLKKKYFIAISSSLCLIYSLGQISYLKVWKNSETLFLNITEKYPNSVPLAHNNLGLYYKEQKQLKKAAHHFQKAIALDASFHKAFTNLANIYFHTNQFEKAIPIYRKVIAVRPREISNYSNMGACFMQLGKNDSALKYFDKTLTANPRFQDALSNRALLYLELNHYEKAKNDLSALLELLPKEDEFYNARGITYQRMGKQDSALLDFNKAISLHSGKGKYYANRTLSYYYQKNYEKAYKDIQKAKILGLEVNPKYVLALEKHLDRR